jgi:hypothetical protein
MFVMESPTLGISGPSLKHSHLMHALIPSRPPPYPPFDRRQFLTHGLQTFLLSDYRAKSLGHKVVSS